MKKKKVLEVTHRTKGKNELICETIAWMNWENVRKIMEFLDWTWDNDGVPDTDDLKEQAFKLLRTAYDEAVENIECGLKTDKSFIHSAGGLRGCVDVENGEIYQVSIDFVVESWCTEALESLTHYEMA